MELCEGLTLTEVLMDTGPLDAAEGAYVGIEICRALSYAHRKGNIVHRDVTPRNVLLDEEGAVRLIDFGIAAPVSAGTEHKRVEVFGSPGHMPLEQLRGERLTPATDVFAVGALLIEAWTGRPPFRRGSFEASADALYEPQPQLTDDHPELLPVADVVQSSIALRAEERPQEAEALARRLRDFSRQFDLGDVGRRLGDRVRRARRRGRSSLPWLPGESSGPLTPAASPQALLSSRPAPRTPVTPPMHPHTPVTPEGEAPVTRTFAAREDIVEWTRKLASLPPPPEPSVPPPPKSPLPSVVDTSEPATRAMPKSSVPAPHRPFPWAIAGSAAVAVTAVAFAALRSPAPPAPVAAAVRVVASPERPQNPAPSAAVTPSPGASVLAAPPSVSVRLPPKPSAEAPSAILRLTADPPATVTVVGGRVAQTLSTPVRGLKVPPGTYSITFRSPTFGEPVVARLELSASASRSVHADFRAALPTVQVR
jgi:serine/threonine-protein kinase